jgi:Xaa-Pro aminopeptidase
MPNYLERIERVRGRMAERGLDAILVTHPTNRRYLTGFPDDDLPPDETAGHVIISRDRAILVVSSRDKNQALAHVQDLEVQAPEVVAWHAKDTEFLSTIKPRRLGYESNALLVGIYHGIDKALREAEVPVEWVEIDGLVEELRVVKAADELLLLRRAFAITCEAFNTVAPTIRAGETEIQVARRLDDQMIALGAEAPAFTTIVAAGPNAAIPHHVPGGTVIEAGVPIIIDMGARYEGYCADLTRTVWLGEPDEKLREVYPIVTSAVEQVFERLHPGMAGKEADRLARAFIERHGYGDAFVHSLGHGVGLRVHEAPRASKASDDKLDPGHIVTIEPGIYLPGWGGVRVEDVVLVTENGFEILTESAEKRVL